MGIETLSPENSQQILFCGQKNTQPALYGQWLAWQITLDHAIGPVEGVEPVELVEYVAKFERQVVIEASKDALEKAKRDCKGLVMWTDGSKLD